MYSIAKIDLLGSKIDCKQWNSPMGIIGKVVVIDTETSPIVPGQIPNLILLQAYSGGDTVWLVEGADVPEFMAQHHESDFVFHNAAFDMRVIEKRNAFSFTKHLRENRVWCTMLGFQLIELAQTGKIPLKSSLAAVAEKELSVVLDKDEELRTGWENFVTDEGGLLEKLPADKIAYAATDVVITEKIYGLQKACLQGKPHVRNDLSLGIQVRGAYSLAQISDNGLYLDVTRRETHMQRLRDLLEKYAGMLAEFGYYRRTVGNQSVLQELLKKFEETEKHRFPRTVTGKISATVEDLEAVADRNLFAQALLHYRATKKLIEFFERLDVDKVYPRYRTMVNTGRTSCSAPNVQNLPRTGGVRECFCPRPGHSFVIADYAQLELCTLAQVCLKRHDASRMAVLINRGIDLHRWFAAEIANKPIEKVTKEERQAAKAANFGFPGGLGIGSFVAYAQATFGVEISEQEAKRLREKWLDAFPEMRLYLADPWLSRYNFAKGPTSDEAINLAIARRIAAGLCQKNGDAYKPSTTKWFFEQVLPRIAPHKSGIVSGSADLANELARTSVHTLSGRIRANCYYSQAKNTPFQGLASDGAKEALFDLCSEGYTPNAFIHDEVLVEVPTDSNLEMHGHRIAEIMIAAMQRVVPDVKIAVEWAVADRWYKGAKLVRNEAGVVVPYTE